jgi:hypothetical protein
VTCTRWWRGGRRRARGAGGPRPGTASASLRCRDPHTVKGQGVGPAGMEGE